MAFSKFFWKLPSRKFCAVRCLNVESERFSAADELRSVLTKVNAPIVKIKHTMIRNR